MEVLILITAHWFLSLFCQSFFLHRYCSHGMFKMNKFWERGFYLLTYLAQGASFLNPSSYSVLHQRHHAYSDTQNDPHSPHHSKNIWKMMLETFEEYKYLIKNYRDVKDQAIKHRAPVWENLDRFAETSLNIYMWICIFLTIYYFMGVQWYYYFAIPLHFLLGPIQGAIVNWFGHTVGYRNYDTKDKSKNTIPIDFALMGELYQNNHHKFGNSLNFAHRWFEIDFTYQLTRVLSLLRIIQVKD